MNQPPSVFKCKCGAPLGEAVGVSLRLYVKDTRTGDLIAVEFDEKPVSPRCGRCKRKRVWVPGNGKRAEAA